MVVNWSNLSSEDSVGLVDPALKTLAILWVADRVESKGFLVLIEYLGLLGEPLTHRFVASHNIDADHLQILGLDENSLLDEFITDRFWTVSIDLKAIKALLTLVAC